MKKNLACLAFLSAFFTNVSAQCFKEIASSELHRVGIKTDGTLWSWGYNLQGQLGNSPINLTFLYPRPVDNSSNWKTVKAGSRYTIALKTDGTLWAWGANQYGQLGTGNTINTNTPTQIGTANDWVSIETALNHCLAIKANGTLWAWGTNVYGQLGNNTTIDSHTPVQIGTDNKWVKIAAFANHCLALKSNNTLWAWGDNSVGQLGIGNAIISNIFSPIQIGTANDWTEIATGMFHSVAIKADGSIWSWGYNTSKQLGYISNNPTTAPAQIGLDKNWKTITAGYLHNVALKTDGSIWAWGGNWQGQLGLNLGLNTSLATPTQIGSEQDWAFVNAEINHSLALKRDGSLFFWGGAAGGFGNGERDGFEAAPLFIDNKDCNRLLLGSIENTPAFATTNLFPNPTQAGFTLQIADELVANAQVNILNGLGQLVYTQQIQQANTEIQLHNQPVGMYLVQIRTANNQVFTHKLLKQ